MNAIGTAAKYVVDYVLRLAKEDDEAGAPVDGDTKAVKAFSGRDR